MKLLKASFLVGVMILFSATLGMLMAVMAISVGNTLLFSEFAGWVCTLAFLFICAVNWRPIAMKLGLQMNHPQEDVD
jgi:hypothetical protein